MQSIIYDSITLQVDRLSYDFFHDDDDVMGPRQNSEAESAAIKWILRHPFDKNQSLIRDELQIPADFLFFPEVKDPIIIDTDGPGDIDLLAVNPHCPDQSIGMQVKRFKAGINENDEGEIKITNLKKGIMQTTQMFKKYRFARNYLMLLVVCDARHRRNASQLFRRLSLDEKYDLYFNTELSTLPGPVGIFAYEINQPSLNGIDHTAGLASVCLRPATAVDQRSQTTDAITQMLKEKGLL